LAGQSQTLALSLKSNPGEQGWGGCGLPFWQWKNSVHPFHACMELSFLPLHFGSLLVGGGLVGGGLTGAATGLGIGLGTGFDPESSLQFTL